MTQRSDATLSKPILSTAKKISAQQLYLTYSYDFLAMLTSLVAVSFVIYSIYAAKVLNIHANQNTLAMLILLNLACIIASFLFKNKLQKLA